MNFPVGIQLFSVRDSMEKDFEGTLARISELGYSFVEFAGFFGQSAEEVNSILNKYNLKISGTHSPFDDLLNNYDETVAFHKAIGNKNYIIPGYDVSSQIAIDSFVEKVNTVNSKLAKDGITFSYHNHDREVKLNTDGSVPFEQLFYRTDIKFEIDTYWAFVGMKHPMDLLDRYHDRVTFIHLKDGSISGEGTPLGMGQAPVKGVINCAQKYNIPIVVESETLRPDGLTEAEICIDYLKSL